MKIITFLRTTVNHYPFHIQAATFIWDTMQTLHRYNDKQVLISAHNKTFFNQTLNNSCAYDNVYFIQVCMQHACPHKLA